MTSNPDITRAAQELISQLSLKGASDRAADRIAELTDRGDKFGAATWRLIRGALLDLSDIQFKDDMVHGPTMSALGQKQTFCDYPQNVRYWRGAVRRQLYALCSLIDGFEQRVASRQSDPLWLGGDSSLSTCRRRSAYRRSGSGLRLLKSASVVLSLDRGQLPLAVHNRP
jgi:hypothetical protein